jgi:Na+/H+-dicarboxylate symporter
MVKYINIILFTGMLVMNYLANALPLNNKTTGELSDSFPNLFVPAGITFSIWGIIYLLLIAFCIAQFTGSSKEVIADISWLFGISGIMANCPYR